MRNMVSWPFTFYLLTDRIKTTIKNEESKSVCDSPVRWQWKISWLWYQVPGLVKDDFNAQTILSLTGGLMCTMLSNWGFLLTQQWNCCWLKDWLSRSCMKDIRRKPGISRKRVRSRKKKIRISLLENQISNFLVLSLDIHNQAWKKFWTIIGARN